MYRRKHRQSSFGPAILGTLIALGANTAGASNVQDLVRIKGNEKNILTGLGLVIGLDGTGDKSKDSLIAARPMAQYLMNIGAGVARLDELAKADAYAIVQVTMVIPATGAREGDEIDVYIDTLFNAKSIESGRLVPSMLRLPLPDSADMPPLAMAMGQIVVEGSNPRSGVIRSGGQVFEDQAFRTNHVSAAGIMELVIHDQYATYQVATVIAEAINDVYVTEGHADIAKAIDQKNIKILLPKEERAYPPNFIATIMGIDIDLSFIRTPARIVVNEKIGSIVITGNVEISPVAISHEGLSITTITPQGGANMVDQFSTTQWAKLDTTQGTNPNSAKLEDLVAAFEQLNVPARIRIAILDQLKTAGVLHAEIIRQ